MGQIGSTNMSVLNQPTLRNITEEFSVLKYQQCPFSGTCYQKGKYLHLTINYRIQLLCASRVHVTIIILLKTLTALHIESSMETIQKLSSSISIGGITFSEIFTDCFRNRKYTDDPSTVNQNTNTLY
jgi:hypothetical protein